MDNDGYRPHPVEWTDGKVSRYWDYLAETKTGEFFSEKHSADLVGSLLRGGRPRLAVDIGCGTGPFVAALARRGIRAIGVDSSAAVLDLAREAARGLEPAPEFHLGSVAALPLDDGVADAATLFEVVEHLDDATLRSALVEARRILSSGGRLMITTPNAEDLRDSTVECPDCGAQFHVMQHVRRWTAETLRAALSDAGFGRIVVRGTRLVENGPAVERIARRTLYRLRRQRPRLVAFAIPA